MAESIDKNQSVNHAQSTRLVDRWTGGRRIDQHTSSASLCPSGFGHRGDLSLDWRPTGSGETDTHGQGTSARAIFAFRMSATYFRKCSIDKPFRYIPLHSTVGIRQRINSSLIYRSELVDDFTPSAMASRIVRRPSYPRYCLPAVVTRCHVSIRSE